MVKKLALGTVQFGLNYGINNEAGQVKGQEVDKILAFAKKNGIDTLDTAWAYGNSEQVLGEAGIENFNIVSKLPPCNKEEAIVKFNESLQRLKSNSLYAYMFHNFSIYKKDKSIWDTLLKLKENKKVKKIGFSIYSPEELDEILQDKLEIDIIQFPYNIFDRRFESYFVRLKSNNIEIHIRSTFLQGLFFKAPNSLPSHFISVKEKFEALEKIKAERNLSTEEICLGFVFSNLNIDKVVIGVDSEIQLKNNIESIKTTLNQVEWEFLDDLKVNDISIINPSLWKNE